MTWDEFKKLRAKWDEFKKLRAKKKLELASLYVEIARHNANLQQLRAEQGPDGQPLIPRDAFTLDVESQIAKLEIEMAEYEKQLLEADTELDSVMEKLPTSPKVVDRVVGSKPLERKRIAIRNPLKSKISELRNTHCTARMVCLVLDGLVERCPFQYRPLTSWQKRAPGKRTWMELYDDPVTHNGVKTFINRIPPSRY